MEIMEIFSKAEPGRVEMKGRKKIKWVNLSAVERRVMEGLS